MKPRKESVRAEVIVAVDAYVSRMLNGGRATTSFQRLFREVNRYLTSTCAIPEVYMTERELAIGWLIREHRIKLRSIGTNASVDYCGSEPLELEKSVYRFSFDDVPLYAALIKAIRDVEAADQILRKARRLAAEAHKNLWNVHDSIRSIAQTQA